MLHEAIAIGVSFGGMDALSMIIPELPKDYPQPVMIVQHRPPEPDHFLAEYLDKLSDIHVKEAASREVIRPECVYIAPSGYHLQIERDRTFSLSVDPPVNYAIPSIDVLFETAADVYQDELVGVILTGANSDGSRGLKNIKDSGGLTVVQDPKTAAAYEMPGAAIDMVDVDHILPLNEIGLFLRSLNDTGK